MRIRRGRANESVWGEQEEARSSFSRMLAQLFSAGIACFTLFFLFFFIFCSSLGLSGVGFVFSAGRSIYCIDQWSSFLSSFIAGCCLVCVWVRMDGVIWCGETKEESK